MFNVNIEDKSPFIAVDIATDLSMLSGKLCVYCTYVSHIETFCTKQTKYQVDWRRLFSYDSEG
jgi:hypothetical protein